MPTTTAEMLLKAQDMAVAVQQEMHKLGATAGGYPHLLGSVDRGKSSLESLTGIKINLLAALAATESAITDVRTWANT